VVRYTLIASDKRMNEDLCTIIEIFHSFYNRMPDVSIPMTMELIKECCVMHLMNFCSFSSMLLMV